MTGNRSQLTNFVNKFLGTIKFDNDQIAKIMGYRDYQIENVTISRVYYAEGIEHNLFSIGQFCDSNIEVAFRKHTCFVCNLEGVDLLSGSWGTNLYTLSIGDMINLLLSKDKASKFIIKFLKMIQVRLNGTVRNIRTDNVVTTTCYTQNRSLIRLHHGKTPYELMHDRKPDLSYLHVFGALCYPTNDSEDLGKLKAKADVGPALNEMNPGTLSSGLVPQPPSSTPFVPPTRNDWDTLLQSLFDEYFRPSPCVDHPVLDVTAPEPAVLTGTPSSTSVDQDAPSPSTSQTPHESPSQVTSPSVEEADHDTEVVHMDNNPYVGFTIPEPSSKESSSQTKDHPIDNVIGDPSRPVSTRHQLQTKALFCYFDAFLSSVEPKSYKEALTESCWIEAMKEELNEFERIEVWELVPRPNRVMIITWKWIYKVKLDELGGVLKNKSRLVARGYRQEEGIDFEEYFL
ncbi:integrase, catalytic region, zinc finger, CCHC-type containing protein [Tanacetum coccineum]